MKNFLDITDIDIADQLTVSVKLKFHGHINCDFWVNENQMTSDTAEFKFNLFDSIRLNCFVYELQEGHSGVEILSIAINNLEILPKYQHLANPPTAYIDKIGLWTYEISSPFYVWYHQITGQGWIA